MVRPKMVLLVAVLALGIFAAACGSRTATSTLTTLERPNPTATEAPTEAPTEATQAPTAPPTEAPTEMPTEAATEAAEPAVDMVDDLGNRIILPSYPQRIVSLAPSITESLFAIGAGDRIVGRDTHSDYPPEVQDIPDIGSLWQNLPLEAILALEPDLVIAAEIISPEQVKQMQDAGLTVFWLKNPTDFEGLYRNLRVLAQLTGQEAQAEELIQHLQTRVAAVEEAVAEIPDEARPVVFYELSAEDPAAPWTAGPGTFIDYTITKAGGKNAGAVLQDPWAQMSLETLLDINPDIILLGDAPYGVTPEAVAQRPGWDALKAVQEGRVYPFNPKLLSVPGPRLIDGLETLAVLLHPDLFCAAELVQPDPQAVELVCPVP
ncbi:MAG: ABC transporter substrate-binding protein [Chloroflexi bacterium]|nr:ABC transporter substrate-binding protein [Chloroflexota bacterium]